MSGQQTPKQARVIDPILSNVARAYKNAAHVLQRLFPVVPVVARGGQVIKFTKDSFRRYNTRRAPGADTKRLQVGYGAEPFALVQDSLEALTPVELQQESATIDIDLRSQAVMTVMDSLMLGTEYTRAQLATTLASFGAGNKIALAGVDQWSDPSVNLKDQIDVGRENVRKGIGSKPNILTMSPGAYLAAQNNDRIRDQFKYTGRDSVTMQMLAQYFQVDEVLVPEAVSLPEGAAETDDFEDVWGNFVLLAHVPSSVRGMHVPSFGYTYRLVNYPLVEQSYYDNRAKSDVSPVTLEEQAYLTAPEAGYIFSNVI